MNFLRKFKFILISVTILGVFVLYFTFKPEQQPRIDTVIVENTDLKQFVSVVGTVKASQDADLAFENSGKINKVYVDIGSVVEADTKLAELNYDDLQADLQQAVAQLLSAQASLDQYEAAQSAEEAKLAEMKLGTRQEEIVIAQTKVDDANSDFLNAQTDLDVAKVKAQTDLDNLYDDVINTLNEAHTKADNAINTQLDDLFTNTTNIEFTFKPNNSQLELDTLNARRDALSELHILRLEMGSTHTENSEYDTALVVGKTSLTSVRYFLNLVGDILDGDTDLSATTLASYKTNLNTARTNVNSALSDISDLQQSISAQKNTNTDNINSAQATLDGAEFDLAVAQNELDLKLAGYTAEQISAQEAKVEQAKANVNSQKAVISQRSASVSSAKAKIEKSIIYSPIKGIITVQDAKEGEIVSANTNLISVISESEYEIEAHIPEVDISKIEIGDKSEVVLDAYPDDNFEAEVVSVNPAERVIEGVATYKVVLQFLGDVSRVKPGMTADLEIMTDMRNNIIAIPQRAIIYQNGDRFVRILDGDDVVEKTVRTGVKGSDGKIEILEGLSLGELLITFIEE